MYEVIFFLSLLPKPVRRSRALYLAPAERDTRIFISFAQIIVIIPAEERA